MSRSFGQYCGLARALDVVGDRWNLLIVRQLLVGPARYRDLLDGLPGVATNLLADRLRELESAGVVERRRAQAGNAVQYALTPWGAELREPIEGLVRWSTPLMVRGPEGDHFRTEWLLIALPALLGNAKGAARSTVGVAVNDEVVQLRGTRSGIEVGRHDGRDLDAVVRTDPAIVLGLAAGVLELDGVRELVDIEGDEKAVHATLAGRPVTVASPAQ